MSNSTAHTSAINKREYRLGKRADKQAETRRRIVEAAVDLHSSLGPARTTVSQIAQRAGVQRHTYYAHFPEERDLFLACSSLTLEREPLPDPHGFRSQPAGRDRVRHGLTEVYGWYSRNAALATCILRDAESHDLTREMVELRMAPVFEEAAQVLGEDLAIASRALLSVALDFWCWRKLAPTMSPGEAANLMSEAVLCV